MLAADVETIAVGLLLLAAAIQDAKAHEISDWISAAIALVGVAYGGLGMTVHGVAMLAVLLLMDRFQRDALGGGDIKLCAALAVSRGFFTGLALLTAALIGVIVWAMVRKSRKAVAVAPFLFVAYGILIL